MEMSFKQYIDNPMGKKNAVFSQRDMYKNFYTEKFDKIFLREAGKINFTLYRDKEKDKYIAHIKIPSETLNKFYYDAVILFFTNDPAKKASNTLQDYSVKFFSNDPAFVFTYLRVFLKNDLFFEDLKSKSSKLALKNDPKEKNPYEIPGYSKILYFAYLFMKMKNLFSKSMWDSYAINYNEKKLLAEVMHTDEKIALRQELGEKAAKEARKEKKKIESTRKTTIQNNPKSNIKLTKTVDHVKSSNTVKNTKTSKTVNTVKKINKK